MHATSKISLACSLSPNYVLLSPRPFREKPGPRSGTADNGWVYRCCTAVMYCTAFHDHEHEKALPFLLVQEPQIAPSKSRAQTHELAFFFFPFGKKSNVLFASSFSSFLFPSSWVGCTLPVFFLQKKGSRRWKVKCIRSEELIGVAVGGGGKEEIKRRGRR